MAAAGSSSNTNTNTNTVVKDWRDTIGLFDEVRDQDGCSCYWAIVACELIECMRFLCKMERKKLSPQYLVDIMTPGKDKSPDGKKCYTYTIRRAFKLIKELGGICLESVRPFVATRQPIPADIVLGELIQIEKWFTLEDADEETLMAYVDKHPIGACIYVQQDFDAHKKEDIYMGPDRNSNMKIGAHAVSLVGYGTERKINYWIIRSSWGARWGDNGYGRICRASSLPPGRAVFLDRFIYPTVKANHGEES